MAAPSLSAEHLKSLKKWKRGNEKSVKSVRKGDVLTVFTPFLTFFHPLRPFFLLNFATKIYSAAHLLLKTNQ